MGLNPRFYGKSMEPFPGIPGKARAKVMRSCDKWYGVTYQNDKPKVCAAIAEMTAKGTYPDNQWEV